MHRNNFHFILIDFSDANKMNRFPPRRRGEFAENMLPPGYTCVFSHGITFQRGDRVCVKEDEGGFRMAFYSRPMGDRFFMGKDFHEITFNSIGLRERGYERGKYIGKIVRTYPVRMAGGSRSRRRVSKSPSRKRSRSRKPQHKRM
jgi:hypothetical protein